MSINRFSFFLLVVLTVCVVAPSFAQDTAAPPRPSSSPAPLIKRGYFSINGGYQATATSVTSSWSFPYAAESASVTASYPFKAGFLFDIGGGVRVVRNFTVGVSVSRYGNSVPAAFSGSVPHPLYFNQMRSVSGTVTGLQHNETGIHIQGMWTFVASKSVQVGVFGGPSVFSVNSTLVTSPTSPAEGSGYFNEAYPFDTVTLGNVRTEPLSKTAVGVNVGADITFLVSRQINVGTLIRFTRASLSFTTTPGNNVVPMTVGGLQIGAGLRYRF